LHAAINSLDWNKSDMAKNLLMYLTSEKSGCFAFYRKVDDISEKAIMYSVW
jgi:hypothetical protein